MKNGRKVNPMPVLLCLVLLMASPLVAAENVEWETIETLRMEAPSRDIAFSPDGSRIFVLSETGEIHIFSSAGSAVGSIRVGKEVDQIRVDPKGDLLILNNRGDKSIRIVKLSYVQDIDVTGAPFKGAEAAPVVLTVFDDFECPYCARLVDTLDQVVELYPDQVKLVFKHFPLRNHAHALKAAIASLAAEKQGKFWELHDRLFANYNQLSDPKIEEIAQAVNLDMEKFKKDLEDPALVETVRRDIMQGVAIGVRGTPTLFINGRRLEDRSLEGFRKAIDQELKKIGPNEADSNS